MSDDLAKRLRENTHMYQVDCELKMKCADRIEELEAKLDWMIVKLDWVIAERDETFALMLDRAETAEAKLAKAVEIAELFSGGVEYDYHGNIIGDEERKAMAELEELTSSVAANNEVKGGKDE